MTDAVLSQIEQILQGIETRTPHASECETTYMRWRCSECGEKSPNANACTCDYAVRVRTEIARTVERMIAEVRTEDPADSRRKRNDAFLAAGGTEP